MSLWKRGRQYWTDFTVAGRRYRKRLGTTNLRTATRRERELVEEAGHGRLAADEQGPKRLSDAIDAYLAAKRIRCSPRTIELEEERLSLVKKHFGDVPLSAITATAIAEFQRTRHEAGIANRTINMDVGVLSRVLKSCGRWRALADHVHNLPERQHPVGRALTADERKRLFQAAASNPEWETCLALEPPPHIFTTRRGGRRWTPPPAPGKPHTTQKTKESKQKTKKDQGQPQRPPTATLHIHFSCFAVDST